MKMITLPVLSLTMLASVVAFAAFEPVDERLSCGMFRQFAVIQSDGKTNVVSVCDFDEREIRVDVVAVPSGELRKTSDLALAAEALAAVNGSYYIVKAPFACENYLAVDGCELTPGGTNAVTHTQRSDGLLYTSRGRLRFAHTFDGRRFVHEDAMACGPQLMDSGRRTDLSAFPKNGFYAARHPRSAIGRTATGHVLLVTVDGRAKESDGMSVWELQDLMASLGCRDALNLDGGGSTTLWAEGEIRNHPCDNGKFDAAGERRVQNAVVVTRVAAVEPADGAVIPLVPAEYKDFLARPRAARKEAFSNETERARMKRDWPPNRPLSVRLVWPEGPGELVVERVPDGKVFFRGELGANTVLLRNLEIARTYRWRVTPKGSAPFPWRTFRTEGAAPRLIDWPGVPNVRDLGGRKGLGGRRVRQGLVYRSAGLNGNAHGKPGERKPGGVRLTAETARWGREWLGLKTDLDLRSPPEIEFMTESPLGPQVRWINISSMDYGGLGCEKGKKALAACFRVFLEDGNLPLVFHCISGADRTGSLATVLNGLLGVDEEELYRDWEVTGLVEHGAAFCHALRFDHLMRVFDRYPGATVNERIEAYVKDCGITTDEIARFRNLMLEPDGSAK